MQYQNFAYLCQTKQLHMKNTKKGYVIVRRSAHAMYADKQVTFNPCSSYDSAVSRASSYGADYYATEVVYTDKNNTIKLIGSYNFQTK